MAVEEGVALLLVALPLPMSRSPSVLVDAAAAIRTGDGTDKLEKGKALVTVGESRTSTSRLRQSVLVCVGMV